MPYDQKAELRDKPSGSANFQLAPSAISLPKGGGAIRGIGEKFGANPVTGTIQGCLSYFVAGIAKVVSPVWRSGEAVRRIVSTRTYGSTRSAALVRGRDGACIVLSWLVMLFECTFPLALAFGQTGFAVFAILGICFHITNAVIMGPQYLRMGFRCDVSRDSILRSGTQAVIFAAITR